MKRCRHDLAEGTCALCRAAIHTPRVVEGPTIPARFDSKCTGCGDPIIQGEDIHLTDSGWVCTSCSRRAISA